MRIKICLHRTGYFTVTQVHSVVATGSGRPIVSLHKTSITDVGSRTEVFAHRVQRLERMYLSIIASFYKLVG